MDDNKMDKNKKEEQDQMPQPTPLPEVKVEPKEEFEVPTVEFDDDKAAENSVVKIYGLFL